MKKLSLSLFVIFSFALYSIFARKSTASVILPSPQLPISTMLPTTSPTSSPTSSPRAAPAPRGKYKDGVYTGDVTDAFYGNIQVRATIAGGKIVDVVFLQYPSDRDRSIRINSQAMPYLKQEAISAQTASVDIVSGATATSQAFIASLASALNQAI